MPAPLLSLQKFKGIVFDWDGVLAETRLDFSPIRKRFFGGRRVPLIEGARKLPPDQCEAVMSAIKDEEMRGALMSEPVPGAFELIAQVESLGIPWCVMSRNCRESIEAAAKTIGFSLPALSWGREAEFVKPDPRAFSAAAAAMGVDVHECLVIGDFLYELMGARRAGARCVLVNRQDEECASYADASFAVLSDFTAAFVEDRPLVPWEYHGAAQKSGISKLVSMYKKSAVIDKPLRADTLLLIERLASYGLGTLSVPEERNVTALELTDTPGLAPKMLARPLIEAIEELEQARYPLLKISAGTEGTPLSLFEDEHD